MVPQIKKMVAHQIKLGGLSEGQTAYVKLGGDGTTITKKDHCTAHTLTLSNENKAVQISTVSLVLEEESYEVGLWSVCLCLSVCPSVCPYLYVCPSVCLSDSLFF